MRAKPLVAVLPAAACAVLRPACACLALPRPCARVCAETELGWASGREPHKLILIRTWELPAEFDSFLEDVVLMPVEVVVCSCDVLFSTEFSVPAKLS